MDVRYKTVLVAALLGLLGGIVKVCGEGKHTLREIFSALFISGFVGMLTGMLLYDTITNPMYFGAVCAMAGYVGNQLLYRAAVKFQKVFGTWF
jgi:LydA holin phage, holin superfamily III